MPSASTKQIIGLVGYAGAGKDTAAEGLIEQGWLRVSFADPLRDLALSINPDLSDRHNLKFHIKGSNGVWSLADWYEHCRGDWTKVKGMPSVRRFLQRLGTECRHTFGEDCWVEKARETIARTHRNVVVTDCRFFNEFDLVEELGGHLVLVEKPGVGPVNDHISESFVGEVAPASTIYNCGTPEDIKKGLAAVARQLAHRACL